MILTLNIDEHYAEIQAETPAERELEFEYLGSEYNLIPPACCTLLSTGSGNIPWTKLHKHTYTKR